MITGKAVFSEMRETLIPVQLRRKGGAGKRGRGGQGRWRKGDQFSCNFRFCYGCASHIQLTFPSIMCSTYVIHTLAYDFNSCHHIIFIENDNSQYQPPDTHTRARARALTRTHEPFRTHLQTTLNGSVL